MRHKLILFVVVVLMLPLGSGIGVSGANLAVVPGNADFLRTWERTDRPVADGIVSRTWMWGPEANTDVLVEPYVEGQVDDSLLGANLGERAVQYYDKARMEITDPGADSDSTWYVTNGLLVVELVTGNMQVGHNTFDMHTPSETPVAGDADDVDGPTYATFGALLGAAPAVVGAPVMNLVDRAGIVTEDAEIEALDVTIGQIDEVTNHAIAAPFWDFMNSSGPIWENDAPGTGQLFENPYFATGRPITEPYGARVKVAGTLQLVIIQCFERRCLTFTVQNEPEWQVEAGNVGQHYYKWRYAIATAPQGDYGDAPDGGPTGYPTQFEQTGSFPTLFTSGGAHTLDLSQATLGPTASPEIDADDSADPDGQPNLTNTDADDGVTGLTIALTQIPPPAVLGVNVQGGSGGNFFLNVLIDLDMDGNWGGVAANNEAEWVVKNFPVTIGAGEVMNVTPPAFAFANGNRLPDGAWMRIALTSEQVAGQDWDGSGAFAAGEIEDHIIELPSKPDRKDPLPILQVNCGGPYTFPPNPVPVACTVTNMSRGAGTFNWELIGPLTGDVTIAPPLSGGPVAIGGAPGPGNTATFNFLATRGRDLPSTWRFVARVEDPPTEVFDGGVILGTPETSEAIMEFLGESGAEEPQKSADKEIVSPGEYITYTIIVPANQDLEEATEATIIDPILVEFYDSNADLALDELTCNIGECFYDDSENNVVWMGTLAPGDVVEMSFMIMVPDDLLAVEYPESYVNCIQGFDGLQEFSDICASTDVQLPDEPQLDKSADLSVAQPGDYITYSITMPANPELEEATEGSIIDPVLVEFFDSNADLGLAELACNIGECFYDDSENNIVWTGLLQPGDVVEMSFMLMVPDDLLPVEYPESYVNCIQGFDGIEEFVEICASTSVLLPEAESS